MIYVYAPTLLVFPSTAAHHYRRPSFTLTPRRRLIIRHAHIDLLIHRLLMPYFVDFVWFISPRVISLFYDCRAADYADKRREARRA